MNLAQAIQVYAGGPGSGCKGPGCGRKAQRLERALSGLVELYKNESDPQAKKRLSHIYNVLSEKYASMTGHPVQAIAAIGGPGSGCHGPNCGRKPDAGNTYQPEPAEEVAKIGTGKREVRQGVAVYYPTMSDSFKLGDNVAAVVAGRNALSYHDTNAGTKWNYQGRTFRGGSTSEAVDWAVGMHLDRQRQRIQQGRRPIYGRSQAMRLEQAMAIHSQVNSKKNVPDDDLGMGLKTPAAVMRFKKTKRTKACAGCRG